MAEIEWAEFSSVMSRWISEQNATIQSSLRPNTWRRLLKSGVPMVNGLRFFPGVVVKSVLGGQKSLYDPVAVPVCDMLNERFGMNGEGVSSNVDEHIRVAAVSVAEASDGDSEGDDEAAGQNLTGLSESASKELPGPGVGESLHDDANKVGTWESSQWEFPEYDFSREDPEPIPSVRVESVNGRLRYRWTDTDQAELYRVVIDDVQEPDTPDEFRTLAVTEDLTAFDDYEPQSPYRFVTVWAYEKLGATPADGLGQCRLVGRELYVHPLRGSDVRYSEGAVVGSWQLPRIPRTSVVDVVVSRMPQDETFRHFTTSGQWLTAAFDDDGTGYREGFRDTGVQEGLTYTYAVAVRARVGHVEKISVPSKVEQSADSGLVIKVTDLKVMGEAGEDGNWCRVCWTPPVNGSVRIYRTLNLPNPDAAARESLPVEQLDEAGLDDESRLRFSAQPVLGEDSEGLVEIRRVQWPDGVDWDTIHFTPVTIQGDKAAVGSTVTLKRAGEIRDIRLIQRLAWQLVTFSWPGEAVSVDLRLVRRGTPFNPETPPNQTVSRSQYRDRGGFVIAGGLPPEGCEVQLSAVSYFNGERIFGKPVMIQAPELWGFMYAFKWPAFQIFKRFVGEVHVEAEITPVFGDCPQDRQPRFVVVHNSERLPLSPQDGKRLSVFLERPRNDGPGPVPTWQLNRGRKTSVWFSTSGCEGGFFRLFSDTRPQSAKSSGSTAKATERYAVVDPAIEQLRNR